MKLIFIILLLFVVSCGVNDNDCHKCKGGSARYFYNLNLAAKNNRISYNEYRTKYSQAKNCQTVVCGTERCKVHK